MEDLNKFLIGAPFNTNICNPITSIFIDNSRKEKSKKYVSNKISCILWSHDGNCNFYMTGTDIIKILIFKFSLIDRPIKNMKKFEEGVYSDLRYVPGIVENANSELVKFLSKNSCIRTQKKQKVFYWENIDHNFLFLSALKRDIMREAKGLQPTSIPGIQYCPDRVIQYQCS